MTARPRGPQTRGERAMTTMLAAQRMAGAEPTEEDLEIARRQIAGELSGDEAVAEALAAVRARFARS